MTSALDLAELNCALDNARDCAAAGDLTDARYYLTVADHLLASEQEHVATEPQPFPAPVSPPLPDAGATSTGASSLPEVPMRCSNCGKLPREDEECLHYEDAEGVAKLLCEECR
jgi:hypothetical protein